MKSIEYNYKLYYIIIIFISIEILCLYNLKYEVSNYINDKNLIPVKYIPTYHPRINCSNQITSCKNNSDCKTNCMNHLTNDWICLDNICSPKNKSKINESDCNLNKGGILVFDDKNLTLNCFCTYPEYYFGKNCDTKSPFHCNNGTAHNFDLVLADINDFSYCKCESNYRKLIKKIPGIEREIPICIPSNIDQIFKNQKNSFGLGWKSKN